MTTQTLPTASALAAGQYEPGPKLAPGVFLAEAPKGDPSGERRAPLSDDRQGRIVGGNTTTIAEWPWQAAITRNPASNPGNGYERQICGGTLVAPTIIVTAAHCVYNFNSDTFNPASNFASITGRTTLSNSSQGQEIAWSILYFAVDGSGKPLYDPDTSDWDVVFAQLSSSSPSSNSTPIKIAGADEASFWAPGDENAWATGWGHTFFGGFGSDTLREVNLDRLADSVCGTAYGAGFHPETMLCAGEITGDQSPCHGDSGGPLVTPIGGGAFRLIGDISWGFECGGPNLPGNFGRVAEDPVCSALRGGIEDVAGVNVIGPGGCLGPRTLTVSLRGSGTGSVTGPGIGCPGDCKETYARGTSVTLNAAGTGGSTFAGWGGACSGTGACALTMDAGPAEGVTATFNNAPGTAPPTTSPPASPPTCKGKPATIVGTNGNDVRKGTPGKDVIVGLAGNDKLSGLAGKDLICGGKGKDTLKGGKGNDTLYGQKGKDTLKGGPGKDKLKGGAGKDRQVQ